MRLTLISAFTVTCNHGHGCRGTGVICTCVNCVGDVDGSLEAILDILETYNSADCQLHVLNYGVGNITESDVEMAATFDGNVVISVCVVERHWRLLLHTVSQKKFPPLNSP